MMEVIPINIAILFRLQGIMMEFLVLSCNYRIEVQVIQKIGEVLSAVSVT